MASLKVTILGCGSSGGVPRLGGQWGDCDPTNPKNQRTRCSLLVEREGPEGITRVLIDTSPDMRAQLLAAGVGELDAVIYSHAHADHTHGLDDLRVVVYNMRRRLPVWADGPTQDSLFARFGYAFVQPEGSPYPPILEMHTMREDFSIDGKGGPIPVRSFRVDHGSIDALGFRFAGLAYLPDVVALYDESRPPLEDLDVWIIDALRRTPHPTHIHLDTALEWIQEFQPRRAVLTNMHIDMDHDTVRDETPGNVVPAYDGMVIEVDLP